jgi:hypothetical protein
MNLVLARSHLPLLLLGALLASACGGEGDIPDVEGMEDAPRAGLDAGFFGADAAGNDAADSGPNGPDASGPDLSFPDANGLDAGGPDATNPDAANPDASPPDTGPFDSGAPVDLNPQWIGGPCQSVADCPFTDAFCDTRYPGGMCSQTCTQYCPDQTGPLNSVTFCIDDVDGDAEGVCVSRCDFTLSPTGCRAGYVCLPEKRTNQPTYVRYACVPETGVPGRPTPAFDIGAACANEAACNRSTCITGLPGGYCTQEKCHIVGCPTGSQCYNLGGQESFYACLRTCTADGQCRTGEGYECDPDSTCWPTPVTSTWACDLNGAAQDCSTWAAQASTDFVVVTKGDRRLTLCDGSSSLGSWCVDLGQAPSGDKEREGDRKTPEGVFYIPRLLPTSEYYKAFLLSYPDTGDATRGLQAGLLTQSEYNAIVNAQNAGTEPPQNTNLGGLIEIHGQGGVGQDWTWGCIAVNNSVIDILWPVLGVSDTIVVVP